MGTQRQHTVYLGLGSNLGDRASQIDAALRTLESSGVVTVCRVSSLYETEPVGWEGGPPYLNAVACALTALEPHKLLGDLQAVEARAGRVRTRPNAPRLLDLDVLLYESWVIRSDSLVVPHPHMLQRAFVLWPLAEIAPDVLVNPGAKSPVTAREAANQLKKHEVISLWRPQQTILTSAESTAVQAGSLHQAGGRETRESTHPRGGSDAALRL